MQYSTAIKDSVCEISMNGKFTFSDHQKCQEIYQLIRDNSIRQLVVNLEDLNFIDSAALGIFLILRDEVTKQTKQLTIVSPVDQVKKMFQLSRFYDLFTIQDNR